MVGPARGVTRASGTDLKELMPGGFQDERQMIQMIRWSSLVIWLFWLIVYWRGGPGLTSGLVSCFRAPAFRYDALLILGIVLLSNVLLWTGYLVTSGRLEEPLSLYSKSLSLAGGLMILVGAVGTIWCRRQLGELWSARTALLANHRLVDSGPYRFVRHPIYGLACVMTLGTVLVFRTWWNVLAGMMIVALYVLKSLEEERLLAQDLPGYREYQHRVRYRIAPWIW